MPPGEHLIAFNGTALAQFSAAGAERFKTLVAANSHFEQVVRRHRLALGQYPLESASPERLLARNLAEYQLADRILYASDYIRDSFLHAGIAAEKLVRFPLTADPRFLAQTTAEEPVARPGSPIRERTTFDVVYVGSLTVHKGVPLLIDAVRSLPHQDLRLVLVGGWGSRGMRQFVEQACAEDSRITVTRGDPLPHLRAASLYVHAAYEDGFAYAAAEALAAGVPMAVSEDTGMKELLGQDAVVFPTGDLDALREAIEHAHACGAGQ
jgi:glycosyltransferase involved in cell wall biosynthesis